MTEHKPAAWAWRYEDGGLDLSGMFRTQEACGYAFTGCTGQPVPLYLHPPALRMPEPMTDEEMMRALGNLAGLDHYDVWRMAEDETLRRVREANKC